MSDIYPLYNIIAEKPGTKYPNIQLILCAHYDSITRTNPMDRAPGADDNATGVATVLEAARVMASMDFEYTVKFILFSAEEQGMIGSSYYAMWAYDHIHDIRAVINLDMVGYDSNTDGRFEIHSGYLYFSQRLGSTIVQNETNWNLGLASRHKVGSASSPYSDHSPFWNYGYPAVMMIEDFQEFNPFYHQATDLSTHLRQPYFLDMAKLAVGSLASLAVRDSTASPVYDGEPLPRRFRLDAPYPNPFNSSVVIPFAVSEAAEYTLSIHNLLGREIRILRLGMKTPGVHRAVWDGTDSKGDPQPSGVYLVREVLGAGEVRKIVLVR